MGEKIRGHIRSNVVGYVALFFALSGGAAWATHPGGANTISSLDIINGEVRSADIGSGNVQNSDLGGSAVTGGKIAPQAVQGSDVQNDDLTGTDVLNNSLTGDDVQESSLNLAAENWHEVGAAGEPTFTNDGFCAWSNVDAVHNSAAFLRDRHGFVHLKGLVAVTGGSTGCDFEGVPIHRTIFALPAGYRPAASEVHATLIANFVGRVDVGGPAFEFGAVDGAVSVDFNTTVTNAKVYVSLDGITFRCAPSGSDGCP